MRAWAAKRLDLFLAIAMRSLLHRYGHEKSLTTHINDGANYLAVSVFSTVHRTLQQGGTRIEMSQQSWLRIAEKSRPDPLLECIGRGIQYSETWGSIQQSIMESTLRNSPLDRIRAPALEGNSKH